MACYGAATSEFYASFLGPQALNPEPLTFLLACHAEIQHARLGDLASPVAGSGMEGVKGLGFRI